MLSYDWFCIIMSENNDVEVARQNMLALLRKRRCTAIWSEDRPVDWRPASVINPKSGMPFTRLTCWHFIEELLESGQSIEVISLNKPPGKKGYVMLYETGPNSPNIYVKLQIGKDLIGRSFHYSDC